MKVGLSLHSEGIPSMTFGRKSDKSKGFSQCKRMINTFLVVFKGKGDQESEFPLSSHIFSTFKNGHEGDQEIQDIIYGRPYGRKQTGLTLHRDERRGRRRKRHIDCHPEREEEGEKLFSFPPPLPRMIIPFTRECLFLISPPSFLKV